MRCLQCPSNAPAAPICYVPTEPTRPENVETILDADLQVGSAGLLRGGALSWVQLETAYTLHGWRRLQAVPDRHHLDGRIDRHHIPRPAPTSWFATTRCPPR